MKARAAVLHEIGLPRPYADSKPLHIEEIELAPPGRDELLVRIKAAGLCHSDLSVINGDRPRPMPMALGHEAAGIVEQVGEGTQGFEPGDHVALVFVPSCGRCGPCSEGRPALCEPGAAANAAGTLLGGGMRITGPHGKPVHHHVGVSAFAEYAVVSTRSAVKIDPDIPFDEAALFGCAVLTGVGAVVNTAKVFAGASVAVIGLGGVGLNAMLGCIMAGADRVIAIDMIDRKLDLARQLGATDVFNAGDARCRGRHQTGDQRRRRLRLRDGGIGSGAGNGLPDHPARRHHGIIGAGEPVQDDVDPRRDPGGGGADAEGQLSGRRHTQP